MTAIAQELDRKLKKWRPTTASKVEKLVTEIIELADQDEPSAKSSKKVGRFNEADPFFTDVAFYGERVPKDSARNHDKYIYGDEA